MSGGGHKAAMGKNSKSDLIFRRKLYKRFGVAGNFVPSETVIEQYAQVAAWATSRADHYRPVALNEFLHADEADAWLVAYSLADVGNRILITHEVSQPNAKNKIKIPEPCDALGVRYLNSISMFRELEVRF